MRGLQNGETLEVRGLLKVFKRGNFLDEACWGGVGKWVFPWE